MLSRMFSRDRWADAIVAGIVQVVLIGGGIAVISGLVQDPLVRDWAIGLTVPFGMAAGAIALHAYWSRHRASTPEAVVPTTLSASDARRLADFDEQAKLDQRQRDSGAVESLMVENRRFRQPMESPQPNESQPTVEAARDWADSWEMQVRQTLVRYPQSLSEFDAPVPPVMLGDIHSLEGVGNYLRIKHNRLGHIRNQKWMMDERWE